MNDAVRDAFLRMDLREMDRAAHDNPVMLGHLLMQIDNFPVFALPSPDEVLVVCGFVHAFGVCSAWMVAARGFEAQVRTVLPMQRALCASIYNALGFHRMDIEVNGGFPAGMRYAEALGFNFEGVQARADIDKNDLHVFVWPYEGGSL